MSIAEQIYEVAKPLPESLALEALHFIEYLSSKNTDRAEMSDLTRAQEIVIWFKNGRVVGFSVEQHSHYN